MEPIVYVHVTDTLVASAGLCAQHDSSENERERDREREREIVRENEIGGDEREAERATE